MDAETHTLKVGSIELTQEQFLDLLEKHPRDIIEVWLATAESYAEALERKDEEIKKLKKALIEERFWRLWKIADARYENPVQRVTQKAISELKKEGFDIEDL